MTRLLFVQSKLNSAIETIVDLLLGNLINIFGLFYAKYYAGIEFETSSVLWLHLQLINLPVIYFRRRYFARRDKARNLRGKV
jgi:hypothetical protein